ncbi:MAG: hypothetical protein WCV41_00385 [Patescibacteria group bacterium]
MDQKVKKLIPEGLKTGEQVAFVIPFGHKMTKENLTFVKKVTERTKAALPDVGVLSLSTAAHYQDVNGELKSEPYITDETLSDPQLDLAAWKEAVKQDAGVYGLLIGRNFDYAQVVLFLPVGFDEDKIFWQIVELLEGRSISKIERYFKSNIYPSGDFAEILPAGWVIGRGLTDAALLGEVLKLSTIGLFLTGVLFFIQLRSLRQALIATSVVALSFLWTRGAIGLMQITGIDVYERVYILLVFTAQIVAGISFAEHKFAHYQKMRTAFPNASRAEVWGKTKTVHEMISVTAIIAILNFATLYQIGVRGIMEVGLLSALGIVFLLAFTFWLLPALHIIIGGEAKIGKCSCLSVWWDALLGKIISGICRLLNLRDEQTFNPRKRGWQAIAVIIVFAVIATSLIFSGGLIIRTKPLEYIHGTTVYQASEFLQTSGRYGFDRISFLVRSKKTTNNFTPEFIAEADRFQKELQKLPNFREVNSVLDTTSIVARESYHHQLQTTQEVHDALQLIEWDLDPLIKEQLWYDGGLVMFASTNTMDDSNSMGESCDAIIRLTDKFPNLEILPFGKVPAYPRADKYIREGKPINLLTSQWLVMLVYVLWVGWRNRGNVAVRLGAWKTGIVMSTPFIFATSAIAIVMIICRVPLDQATACITAFAINAASDFGLYPMDECRKLLQKGLKIKEALRKALGEKGKIVLTDIFLNCLCFAPLMLSSFIPVQRLGWVMIVMLLACGFGSLVLMPALLPWCVRPHPNPLLNKER